MSLAYASSILGRKFGVYQNLVSSAPSYDIDAQAYFNAVAAAGGTITTANKTAFNTAFLSMKSNTLYDGSSLWSKIYQGYFFVGQESITNGLVIPFGSNIIGGGVNYNFNNYTKTGGLVGDGVSTYIDTQINNNNNAHWPVNDRFVYVNCSNTYQGGFRGPFGVGSNSVRKLDLSGQFNTYGNLYNYRAFNDSATNPNPATTSTSIGNGFGLISTSQGGGYPNCYIASTPVVCANGTPTTSSLVNSNLVLGACWSGSGLSLSYGNQNMMFAAVGYGIYGMGNGFDPQAFQSLDSIVATLISSLT